MQTSKILLLIVVCLLQGCAFVNPPVPPQEDNEPLKECAWYGYEKTKHLIELLHEGKDQEAMTTALELAISAEAIKEWAGPPQDEFNGDIKQLAKEMMEAEANYEHDLSKWQRKLVNFTEGEVTKAKFYSWLSSWGSILFTVFCIGVVFVMRL